MIVAVVWAIAAAFALVVAAFCGFELRWKFARLRGDLADLDATIAALHDLQASLHATMARVSALSPRA